MDAIQLTGDGLDEKFIRTLVDLGADVNFISEECWCPLADAIYAGRPTIVEFLLEKGANPNVVATTPKPYWNWPKSSSTTTRSRPAIWICQTDSDALDAGWSRVTRRLPRRRGMESGLT